MNEDKKLAFFEKLTSLLNGAIKEKSEDVRKNEKFCDDLKSSISRNIEEINKLDFLIDNLDLREYISTNVDAPIERMKEQMDKPWLKAKLTIGLMGHFNSGKTTALNLIFDENFATKHRENTALATYLVYGKNTDSLTIVDKGGKSQVISLADSAMFDYTSGVRNFPFARIFDYLVKESKNKVLENLTFIDTPGLSSSNGHSEPTMNAVSSCDTIFWFVKITDSVAQNDIKFIQENLSKKPIFIVFSFADKVESLDKSVDVAKKSFKDNKIDVKGFFLLGSDKTMQSGFKTDVMRVLHEIIKEYKVYDPYEHLEKIIDGFEHIIIYKQEELTRRINEYDKEARNILDSYESSSEKYSSACKDCDRWIHNVEQTLNENCSNVRWCSVTYKLLRQNWDSMISSYNKIKSAYESLKPKKLTEYGSLIRESDGIQSVLNKSAEILAALESNKEKFKRLKTL